MGDEADRQELQEYLRGLEEERRKVEAFKRELPLCMQLLTDAIQSTQAQLKEDDVTMDSDDVIEPHLPRDRSHHSHRPIATAPRPVSAPEPDTRSPFPRGGGPAWLSEAISLRANQHMAAGNRALEQRMEGMGPQLAERGPGRPSKAGREEGGSYPQLFRTPGAFLPFSREQHSPHIVRPVSPRAINYPLAMHLAQSSMASHGSQENDESPASVLDERRSQAAAAGPSEEEAGNSGDGTGTGTDGTGSTGAMSRKQRRCWSPELHRRFVNALNQLGGSQVATPKQIRELMKVDGLTNDEVKSHLQKYRLHTRRPSPLPTTAPGPGRVVVLGSIWVPPEYTAATSSAAALYDAAAAVAAVPSQGAPNAPAAAPRDEDRLPEAFHPGSFFQVASGLLGPRHVPSNSSTDLTLSTGEEGDGSVETREALTQAEVKERQALLPQYGGFRGFEAPGALGGREEDRGSLHRETRGGGGPPEGTESMTEDSSDAHHHGRKGDQEGNSDGRVVQSLGQHAFRTFLPPRPEASAHKPA